MLRDTLAQLYERDMLPAIWFIFSRKGCDQAVAKLKEAVLLNPSEEEQVRTAVDEFRIKFPDAVREHAVGALYRGIAAHHAGEGAIGNCVLFFALGSLVPFLLLVG